MKIQSVKGFGNLGVSITDIKYPFDLSEIKEIKKLLITELVVALPKINYSTKQFYELTSQLGQVSTWGLKSGVPEPIGWTGYTDENNKTLYPGMFKVTAQKNKQGRYEGMPTGISKRLNWHNNETDGKDSAANFVGLQGIQHVSGSITQVCQMIDCFALESKENQELLKKLNVYWGVVPGDEGIMPDLPKPGEAGYDDIHGSGEVDEMSTKEDMDKYKDAVNLNIKQQPLVQPAPNGQLGIRFTPSQVIDISPEIADGSIKIFEDSKHKEMLKENYKPSRQWLELKERIMQKYVTEEYIYNHVWNKGDIFYMDQITCMHRRTDMNYNVDGIDIPRLEQRLLNRLEVTV